MPEAAKTAEKPKTEAPAATATAGEEEAKDHIHAKIRDMVKEKTGASIGIAGGKAIFDTIVAEVFMSTARDGNFRFPGGFGSLKVVKVAAGKKTLPNGKVVEAPERKKLRYDMGTVVRSQLTKG